MFQNIHRKSLFYLVLLATGLLLFAIMRQTPPVSAQGSNQYVITVRIEQNRDCSVGRYSVEAPEEVQFERLVIKGASTGDEVQCSLILEGNLVGLGVVPQVGGIGAITGPLNLLQVQGKEAGGRIHFRMLSLGRQPPVDALLVQQQLILYVGE
jgi:hypothetical protein